jgi:hypothetical protein
VIFNQKLQIRPQHARYSLAERAEQGSRQP